MSFKKDLSRGDIGERLFLAAHNSGLAKLSGFESDFNVGLGHGIELKSDYWSMDKTPNFFFEKFSDMVKQSPGGPWRSKEQGTVLFVYLYIKDLRYFVFDVEKLVERLEALAPNLQTKEIKNKTWTTLGYLVPRELVADLAQEFELTVRAKEVVKC